jgi:hypothetical protein
MDHYLVILYLLGVLLITFIISISWKYLLIRFDRKKDIFGEGGGVYVLRTCNEDLTSYNGFQWPESGPVEAPDWDPAAECGNGLHGLLWGQGDGTLLDWSSKAKWLVVRVTGPITDLKQKVKFPAGYVEFCGDRKAATEFIISKGADPANTVGAFITVGNNKTAATGYQGTATAGDEGTATAGDEGTATAGYQGTATAGYRGSATAGDGGSATAGNYGKATASWRGSASVGYQGSAAAGKFGMISIKYWDEEETRYRLKVGYIGEKGLKPDTLYKLDENNEFTEVQS